MVKQTVYSLVIFSHRYLDSDRINFKTLVFLAVFGPSEHHHTTQTSKFNNFLNGTSTMLNNVFKLDPGTAHNSVKDMNKQFYLPF